MPGQSGMRDGTHPDNAPGPLTERAFIHKREGRIDLAEADLKRARQLGTLAGFRHAEKRPSALAEALDQGNVPIGHQRPLPLMVTNASLPLI